MEFKSIKKGDFYTRFTTEGDCLEYLAVIKWANGYQCRKCNHGEYMTGKRSFSRRCKSCKYDESATAHTLFHKIKFPLLLAFEITFLVTSQKKAVSSLALSEELELHYETVLNFRRKLQKAMESSLANPLEGNVEVDEFAVGGHDEGKQGRAKGDKKLVSVALEITESGQFGRAYAVPIKNYSSKELSKIFETHISQTASVRTDKWTGYLPLKKVFPLLKQEYSDNGRNFEELHLHIMNIKSWIRGIFHHISEKYINRYMDEFHFRFNRRGFRNSIFHKTIERIIQTPPIFHSQLNTWAT